LQSALCIVAGGGCDIVSSSKTSFPALVSAGQLPTEIGN